MPPLDLPQLSFTRWPVENRAVAAVYQARPLSNHRARNRPIGRQVDRLRLRRNPHRWTRLARVTMKLPRIGGETRERVRDHVSALSTAVAPRYPQGHKSRGDLRTTGG